MVEDKTTDAAAEPANSDQTDTADERLRRGAKLLSTGNVAAALEVLSEAARLFPQDAAILNNLGVALRASGRAEEALDAFGTAATLEPDYAPAFANLAKALYSASKFVDASTAADRALELRPDDSGSMAILGGALLVLGRASKAVPLLSRAVELTKGRAAIRCLLARALDATGYFDAAVEQSRLALDAEPQNPECVTIAARFAKRAEEVREATEQLESAIKNDPNDQAAEFLYTAFTHASGVDRAPDRAPDAYVADLFDRYADRFDAHLVGALRYSAHRLVGEAAAKALGGRITDHIVDAGCGTGLCGEYLRPLTKHLTGIDLSGKMVEKARETGRYDQLHQEEIVRFLESDTGFFDLAAASDVFVYFGDLGPVFAAMRRRLRPGAPFIFTLEWQDQPGWRLTQHGRFVHGPDHIAASATGLFDILSLSNVVLRAELGEPVMGLLCVLEAMG